MATKDNYLVVNHPDGSRFKVHKSLIKHLSEGGSPDSLLDQAMQGQDVSTQSVAPDSTIQATPVTAPSSDDSSGVDLKALASQAADRYGIPKGIFHALIGAESNWDPRAQGVPDPNTGHQAKGLGQFMPATAKQYGLDHTDDSVMFDPAKNLDAAAHYLSDNFKRFGNWSPAVQAYHDGAGAVNKNLLAGNDASEGSSVPDYSSKILAGQDANADSTLEGSQYSGNDTGPEQASTPAAPPRDPFAVPTADLPGNRGYPVTPHSFGGSPAEAAANLQRNQGIPSGEGLPDNQAFTPHNTSGASQSIDPTIGPDNNGPQTGPSSQPIPPGTYLGNNKAISPITGQVIDISPRGPGQPGPGYGLSQSSTSGAFGTPGFTGQQDQALVKQQTDAIRAQTDAQTAAAKAQETILANSQVTRENLSRDFDNQNKQMQAQGQKLFQSILDSKINPNDFWEKQSDFAKVSTIVGAALGGFGSGLVGGGNPTLDMIQGAIHNNIEAQMANLNNKNNAFNHFMNLTHNAQQAYSMTVANLNDVTAGQVAVQAAKSNSPIIQANAQKVIADLQATAEQNRRQSLLQNNTFQMGAMQLTQQQRQIEALNGLRNGDPNALSNPYLPKELRESMVYPVMPDGRQGTPRVLPDKEAASEYRKFATENLGMRNQIDILANKLKDNPRGGIPTTEAATTINSLKNALAVQATGGIEGVSRLTENEYKAANELLDHVGILLTVNPQQGMYQLNALKNMLGSKMAAHNLQLFGSPDGR